MTSSVIETTTLSHWPEYKQRWEFNGDAEEAVHFVGGLGGYEANMQHQFMLDRGLRAEHRFLDIGCGCLRGTIRLVDYLHDGNFYGLDVSMGLLRAALIEVDRLKLQKVPFLQLVDAFDFNRLFNDKFDFILSVSLLPHLYPEDIPAYFKGIASLLAPGGKAYVTLYPMEENEQEVARGSIQFAWQKRSWLKKIAAMQGLSLNDLPERIPARVPGRGRPPIAVVNSNLAQWVMEATLA